ARHSDHSARAIRDAPQSRLERARPQGSQELHARRQQAIRRDHRAVQRDQYRRGDDGQLSVRRTWNVEGLWLHQRGDPADDRTPRRRVQILRVFAGRSAMGASRTVVRQNWLARRQPFLRQRSRPPSRQPRCRRCDPDALGTPCSPICTVTLPAAVTSIDTFPWTGSTWTSAAAPPAAGRARDAPPERGGERDDVTLHSRPWCHAALTKSNRGDAEKRKEKLCVLCALRGCCSFARPDAGRRSSDSTWLLPLPPLSRG